MNTSPARRARRDQAQKHEGAGGSERREETSGAIRRLAATDRANERKKERGCVNACAFVRARCAHAAV
eukprot:3426921-Pleurochrysis_carterae.AAC.1